MEINMGRYIQDVGIDKPFDVVSLTMEDYLYHHHFIRTDWEGEPVYCSKTGGRECYLDWTYSCGILHIEAWIKNVFGNETDLDGVGKEKAAYKNSLTELIEGLRSHSGDPMETGYIGHDPLHHQEEDSSQRRTTSAGAGSYQQQTTSAGANPYQQPTYERPLNIGRRWSGGAGDSQAKLLGILAVFFAIVFPMVGLVLAVVGLSKCKQEVIEDGDAKRAKTFCMIALGIAVLRLVIPFIFSALAIFLSFIS